MLEVNYKLDIHWEKHLYQNLPIVAYFLSNNTQNYI